VVGGHTLIEVDNRQKVRLGLRFSSHTCLTPHFQPWFQTKNAIFNTLLAQLRYSNS
jgi:hypothetical protein